MKELHVCLVDFKTRVTLPVMQTAGAGKGVRPSMHFLLQTLTAIDKSYVHKDRTWTSQALFSLLLVISASKVSYRCKSPFPWVSISHSASGYIHIGLFETFSSLKAVWQNFLIFWRLHLSIQRQLTWQIRSAVSHLQFHTSPFTRCFAFLFILQFQTL